MRDSLGAVPMTIENEQPTQISLPDWAAVWLRYHRERRDADFWAVDSVFLLPLDDPERAWLLTLELIRQADWEELGRIGAGPLEHLVEAHAPEFIDRIESQATIDPKFKEALATIWVNSRYLPSEIVTRLVSASGDEIEPFDLDYDEAERKMSGEKDGA